MGDLFAGQYGGKRWIRYAYEDLDEMIGGASGAYAREHFKSVTPNQSVRLLLASGDVEKVGEEDVRGRGPRTTRARWTSPTSRSGTRTSARGHGPSWRNS